MLNKLITMLIVAKTICKAYTEIQKKKPHLKPNQISTEVFQLHPDSYNKYDQFKKAYSVSFTENEFSQFFRQLCQNYLESNGAHQYYLISNLLMGYLNTTGDHALFSIRMLTSIKEISLISEDTNDIFRLAKQLVIKIMDKNPSFLSTYTLLNVPNCDSTLITTITPDQIHQEMISLLIPKEIYLMPENRVCHAWTNFSGDIFLVEDYVKLDLSKDLIIAKILQVALNLIHEIAHKKRLVKASDNRIFPTTPDLGKGQEKAGEYVDLQLSGHISSDLINSLTPQSCALLMQVEAWKDLKKLQAAMITITHSKQKFLFGGSTHTRRNYCRTVPENLVFSEEEFESLDVPERFKKMFVIKKRKVNV